MPRRRCCFSFKLAISAALTVPSLSCRCPNILTRSSRLVWSSRRSLSLRCGMQKNSCQGSANARRHRPRLHSLLSWRLAGLAAYLGPIIASGPRAAIGPTAFPYFAGLAHTAGFSALLPTILGGALALAIIASIDAPLCAKLVTAPGEPRRDGDRLLMRLEVGNRCRLHRRHYQRHQHRPQHR